MFQIEIIFLFCKSWLSEEGRAFIHKLYTNTPHLLLGKLISRFFYWLLKSVCGESRTISTSYLHLTWTLFLESHHIWKNWHCQMLDLFLDCSRTLCWYKATEIYKIYKMQRCEKLQLPERSIIWNRYLYALNPWQLVHTMNFYGPYLLQSFKIIKS